MRARAAIVAGVLGLGAMAADQPDPPPEAASGALDLPAEALRDVPGTWGDPLRALARLPGATTVVGGAGPLVVRGRLPDATPFYVDGVRVSWPFHALLGPAAISPELVDRVDYYRGEAPARFGLLTGGAVDIHLPQAGPGARVSADADLLTARAGAVATAGPLGTRVVGSVGAFTTPWVLSRFSGALEANLADWQLSVAQPLGPGELRLLWLGAYDGLELRQETAFEQPLAQMQRVDLRWRSGDGLEVSATYGLDRLALHAGGQVNELDLESAERSLQARVRWTPSRAALRLPFAVELGAEVERRQADFEFGALVRAPATEGQPAPEPVAVAYRAPASGVFAAAWAQATATDGALTLSPGLRVASVHPSGGATEALFEPRLWIDYRGGGAWSVHGGAGWYHQPATSLVPLPGFALSHLAAGLSSVLQTSAGVTFRAAPGLDFSADGYWDPMLRSVELSPLDRDFYDEVFAAPSDSASVVAAKVTRGQAYGMEFLLRKELGGRLTGWLSYSVQRSVRAATFQRLGPSGQPLEEVQGELPFALEQAHVLNAVVAWRLPGGWTLSGAVLLRSGAPESGNLLFPQTQREGAGAWVKVSPDEVDRLPPLLRVDARASKAFDLSPFRLEVWLDVYDLSFSRDVLGFSYGVSTDPVTGERTLKKSATGLALPLPMLGVRGSWSR